MVNKAVALLLLLTPIVYKSSMVDKAILFEDYIFVISTVILFIASLMDKPVREIKNNWLIISFLGLCLFNVICHSMIGFQTEEGIISVIKPFTIKYLRNATLFIFCLTIMIRYISNVDRLYKYIVYAVIANILMFDIEVLGWCPIGGNIGLPGGFMGNSARFTNYLAITLPFVFNYSFWLFVVCLITSLMLEPQWGTLFVAIILLYVNINNRLFRSAILASICVGGFTCYEHVIKSFGTRVPAWKNGIEVFLGMPVSGLGLGVTGELTKSLNSDSTISNSILQLIIEGGIGFIGWLYFSLKSYVKNLSCSLESLSIFCLIIMSSFEYIFEIKRLWITLIFILSAFIIKQIDKEA